MALISCPHCGKQVSDKAQKCPHCSFEFAMQTTQPVESVPVSGAVQQKTMKPRKKWPVFVIIGLCMVVASFFLWRFAYNGIKENKQAIGEETEASDERYLTQDLRMWGLFGQVKSFQTTISRIEGPSRWDEEMLRYYDEDELYNNLAVSVQFDNQGHFINTIDGSFTIKEIAKKDGDRIIEAKSYIGDFDFCISKQWSYYPNGMVRQSVLDGLENHEENLYYYNDAGELSKKEVLSAAEGTSLKTTIFYMIKDRDEYGNWTKQIAEVTTFEYDYDKNDYIQKSVTQEMVNRTISYYGQESSIRYVVINGSELRLRLGPSTNADTFKWGDGSNRHPNKGEKYPCLGEEGGFYKIDYKGHEVWVSKQYTYLE